MFSKTNFQIPISLTIIGKITSTTLKSIKKHEAGGHKVNDFLNRKHLRDFFGF